jgi:TolB-like protein
MSLGPGTRLGPYEIQSAIGAGGMGEVYKARDTRLDRSVAIKVLPAEVSADPERRVRIEHEAKTIAGLTHPHICTLYDVGDHEGTTFLVMEHLTGETLAQRLARGPLPLEQALTVGTEIADALAAAHRQGVIHRDLKPGNVMLTKAGAKLLDFGLAKLTARGEPAAARLASAPTARAPLTGEGSIVGTLQYMAPEQVEGKGADARTDLWALGALLYEMVTGQRPFEGGSPASIITAIMSAEPPAVSALQALTPPGVDRLVRKCLQKDLEARWQSASDVADELRWLASGAGATRAATAAVGTRRRHGMTGGARGGRGADPGRGVRGSGRRRPARPSPDVRHRKPRPAAIQWLAVLPVKNFSGDPSQEFFADGMTDALIAGLAQIKAINVISRTSVMQYKDTKKPLPQIAQELGVDGVMEASVQRASGRVRVTAQLLQARQDRHLWADTYDREMTDVLALQSDVVQAIANEIRAQLTPQENKRLKTARRVDPEVYDLAVKGKATLEYATREDQIRQAVALLQQAVDRDPTYAPAWAGLGESLWTLAATWWEFVAPGEVRDKAIAAAEKALELDETLPEGHKARALIAYAGEWDGAKAEEEFKRAIDLRPGYAAAESLYGQILICFQRIDDGRRHIDRARELDPLSPWNDLNRIHWLYFQGKPEKIIEEAPAALQRNPTVWLIPMYTAFARLSLGQPGQAAAEVEAGLRLATPDRPVHLVGLLGYACGLAGRRADALKILAEMENAAAKQYVCNPCIGAVYAGLGRMDEAFSYLDRALQERNSLLVTFTRDNALWNTFRRDPRWKPFIARVRALVRLPPGTPDPYE